jgi:murein DD-endopeptidase MepM/ murein hydrolase activator NlpD
VQRLVDRIRSFCEQRLPERQIYHQAHGRLDFVRISTTHQVIAVVAAAGLGVWLLISTLGVAFTGMIVSSQGVKTALVKQNYQTMVASAEAREKAARAELDKKAKEYAAKAAEMERRHEMLRTLLRVAESPAPATRATGDKAASLNLPGEASLLVDATPGAVAAQPTTGPANPEAQFARLQSEQNALLASAEASAIFRAQELRGVLRQTGIPEAALARRVNAGGQGGPLIDLQSVTRGGNDPMRAAFAKRVERVGEKLAEAERLEDLVQALPLGWPVAGAARETSGFGVRFDPFTRRAAFHSGTDLVAPHGTAILTAASGTVTFAGAKAGYGNVVEVTHGEGFMTRYGHLASISVRLGQSVSTGQTIGGMGSTGRSTGTHLHYEVWFNDTVYDSGNFLRAGSSVQ